MGAINDGGCTRRLAPGSSTCRRWWAQYDCGCTRRLRPSGAKAANRIFPPRRARKSEICSAKIAGYAVDPPPRRLASPFRFAPGLAQLRASLTAHPAVTSRTPNQKKRNHTSSFTHIEIEMEYKKNPHAGFSPAFFQRGCDSCVGEAQMGKAHLRRHANLRFARISRSRAPERKENAIREDSRRRASRRLACRLKRAKPAWAYSRLN
ncbi:hypothetical protein SDC9_41147 [bioreactor metagenome]|uniref:Uncharacterized protein n=1 Tax=bioreactor metagenome TaxID=1076179 RepID=A0A644VU86_9ZZZZ